MSPPFVIQGEDADFRGIAVELWQDMATRLGLGYTFISYDELPRSSTTSKTARLTSPWAL